MNYAQGTSNTQTDTRQQMLRMSTYISYDYPEIFLIFLYSYSLLPGKYVVESRIFRIPFTFFPLIPHNRNTIQRYEIH